MDDNDILIGCEGFDWDKHNVEKNWFRHKVTPEECEQIFFNLPLVSGRDAGHSDRESRFYALGKTDSERKLFVVFTVRDNRVRMISARDMSRKERKIYEECTEE